jgi:chorismate synthase
MADPDGARPSRSKASKVEGTPIDPLTVTRKKVDATPVRCPDPVAAEKMIREIERVRRDGDSLGGIVEAVVQSVPVGLGDPVFDKLEADLAKAMMSLPASKGFEIGSGFGGVTLRGSEHNDPYVKRRGRIGTETNRSGGVQGGISNGEPIVFRVAFKPTATIRKPQQTVDTKGRNQILEAHGRHDPCVLPRAIPLVEAMTSLVLVDHWLRQLASTGATRQFLPRPSKQK